MVETKEKTPRKPRRKGEKDIQPLIVRPEEAATMTGLSRSAFERLEAVGLFPRRVRLTPGRCGYVYAEILAWVEAAVRRRDDQPRKVA